LGGSDDTKTLSILHLFYETHDPHVCGWHSKQPVHHLFYEYLGHPNPGISVADYKRQFLEALAYLDAQLEFYFDLLPQRMVKVIFSDHGQAAEQILQQAEDVGALLSWHDDRIHVVLMVQAPGVTGFTHEPLFSMLDLGQMVLGAVAGNLAIGERDYVPIQFDPIYNKTIRAIFASVGAEKYACAFKALRGPRDKYVLYDSGREEYYLLPDEKTNLIESKDLQSDIATIKAQMPNTTFPDFGKR
jgi:hypothetical protein